MTSPSHRPPARPWPRPVPKPCSLPGGVGCAVLEHGARGPRQIKGPLSASQARAQPLCNADLRSTEAATGMNGCAYLMGPRGLQIIPRAVFSISLWAPLGHTTVPALPPCGHVLTLLPVSRSTLIRHLLYAQPCVGCWGHRDNKTKSWPPGAPSLMAGRGEGHGGGGDTSKDGHNNRDESQNHYAEGKKPSQEEHAVWFH